MLSKPLVALTLLAAALLALCAPAQAGPRVSGRVVKVLPAQRMVVLQRSDGRTVRAVLEKDAEVRRMGVVTKITQFRVGDYVVVSVAGPLNDDPLECDGIFDVHTAGHAPPPTGSVDTSIQGGHAIPGGSAAPMPFPYKKHNVAVMSGGSQNAPQPTFTPQWNPTQPWENVPTEAGQNMPPPVFQTPPMQSSMPAPGVPQHNDPHVGAYGPTAPTSFPATPYGGSYTAAPSPAGNPWLGQAVGQNNTPPAPPSPVVTTTRTMPPTVPTVPTQQQGYYDAPGGTGGSVQAGQNLVSLQGSVTQVVAAQRVFVMQAMINGRATAVQVRVPSQLGILNSRSQTMVGLENLRIGDFVMLTGVQLTQGAVEARRLFVNQ